MKKTWWILLLCLSAARCGDGGAAAADAGGEDAAPEDVLLEDAPAEDIALADGLDDGADLFDVSDLGDTPDEEAAAACPAAALGEILGRDRLMVGGAMEDEAFAMAPFDLRYHYVAGDVPDDGPCDRCDTGCFVRGESCANDAGCAWWGCWQWDQLPPGRFVADFVIGTADAGAIPMITYYIWYSVAGDVEGGPEVAALADGDLVRKYIEDFRFLCRVMAEDASITAMLHIEPDLWGYGEQVNQDPDGIPAAVSAAAAPECGAMPDTMAGLARCMLAIARAEAPNVLAGFHASAWGAGIDALVNADPGFDLEEHAATTAEYMRSLGAHEADLVVVEMSDRDAGFNGRWWDETNATLPNFDQAVAWVASLAAGLGLAPLWWQVPYGHMGLENVCDRYQDNRVDYFFDHPLQFAEGGAIGIAFGAGAACQTTPATDDGHFTARARDYFGSDRPGLCGE